MNNKKDNFQIKFANTTGMLASRFSLSPTVGQLYGLLYMSPDPVSLNEMVDKLKISKGSVSTNIRILQSWGAVKKVWVDNSRKDYYQANPDTLKIVKKRVSEGLKNRLNETKKSVTSLEDTLEKNPESKSRKNFYSKRLKKAKDSYLQLKELLDLFSDENEE